MCQAGEQKDFQMACEKSETFESFFNHLRWKPIFFHHLSAGSFFELPWYYVLTNLTDADRMRIHSGIQAIQPDARPTNESGIRVLIIDTHQNPVGFCRLRLKRLNKGAFYSRNRAGLNGPATKMILSNWANINSKLIKNGVVQFQLTQMTMDEVDGIFCPNWPPEAERWLTRTSVSGWPDKNLKDHIVRGGCHLVAKSHHSRPNDDTQWRYSFSQAEVILINSWNEVQKYIYHILRVIKGRIAKKCKTNEKSIFNNYMFKTLMLRASEEKTAEFWREECIETSVVELLCQAIVCLIDRKCEHYFIHNVNILDHSPDIDTDMEISSLEEHTRKLQSIMILFPKYDEKLNFQVEFSKKFIVHYKLYLNSTYVVNPFSPAFDRYFNDDVENDASLRMELETLFKGLLTMLKLQHATCVAERMDLEKIATECLISGIEDDGENQIGATFSSGDSFHIAFERLANDNCCPTTNGSEYPSSVKSVFQSQGRGDDRKSTERRQNIIANENISNWPNKTQSQSNYIEEIEHILDLLRVPAGKYSANQSYAVIGSILKVIASNFSELYKKPCYLVNRAYCANFYFTCLQNYQTALELCKKTLEDVESINERSLFDTRLSEDVFPVVWSSYWMPLFDQRIQLVFGFLVLTLAVQYKSGIPTSDWFWMPPSSLRRQHSHSKRLNTVIKSQSSGLITTSWKRKFQQKKLLSRVIVQVSAVEFLRYIGVQSRKQLGLGNDPIFCMRRSNPTTRYILDQSLLLAAVDSIRPHLSSPFQ